MEKVSVHKNSWQIYLKNFAKLFFFSFSVIIAFFVCVTIFFIFGDFWIIAALAFAFGLVPLFYCLQIAVVKFASGKDVEYNEFYRPYKAYFSPANKGSYKVLRNIVLTFIIFYLSIYLSIFIYDLFNYGVLNSIIEQYSASEAISMQDYYNMIEAIVNMDGYIYYLVFTLMLPFLFFFARIKKKLLVSYFNLIIPMPNMITQAITKKIYAEHGKEIRKNSFVGDLIFTLCFVVGYVVAGLISTLILTNSDNVFSIFLVVIIALGGGLFVSTFVLPPVLLNYCFIADSLNLIFLSHVKDELKNLMDDPKFNDNEDIKEVLQMLLKNIDQNENVTEEDSLDDIFSDDIDEDDNQ